MKGLFGDIDIAPKKETASHKRRYKDYTENWAEIANTCLILANHKCQDCGGIATAPHHIIPLTKGGTNEQNNLKALCFHCHSKYHPHLRRHTDRQVKLKKLF